MVGLQDVYNEDVAAAIAWIKKEPFVDGKHIVVTGCSYGGIQTLLAAEKGLGVSAFIAFAPAAMSWGNDELQNRLLKAVAGRLRYQGSLLQLLAWPPLEEVGHVHVGLRPGPRWIGLDGPREVNPEDRTLSAARTEQDIVPMYAPCDRHEIKAVQLMRRQELSTELSLQIRCLLYGESQPAFGKVHRDRALQR